MTSTDHVLVVGIDGVRYDTLLEVDTPTIDRLARTGFLAPVRVNDDGPTISGPSWSTIFTGVLTSAHGVRDNDFRSNRYAEHPDVVSVARRARPDLATWVAADWAPLVRRSSGGPLFADGGWHPRAVLPTVSSYRKADAAVTERSLEFLRAHDGTHGSLAVVYLGATDEIAHLRGARRTYRTAIAEADRHLGMLLDAVDQREGEDWTIVVVTDHGHLDRGGHGGDSDVERTAWIAASGPQVPTTPPGALEQADVAAQVLATLGVPPVSSAFVGVPFGSR